MEPANYDHMLDFAQRYVGHFYADKTPARRAKLIADATEIFEMVKDAPVETDGWDQGETCLCDLFHEFTWMSGYDNRDLQSEKHVYAEALACIVRSAADMVSEDCGVLGHTTGDLLAMYPDGLPDWLRARFTADLESVPPDTGVWF